MSVTLTQAQTDELNILKAAVFDAQEALMAADKAQMEAVKTFQTARQALVATKTAADAAVKAKKLELGV
jgi:hypothetical protein